MAYLCESLLTKNEFWDVLISMKDVKSPGNDGLSKKCYVCVLMNFVTHSLQLQTSIEEGQLSTFQRQAIITLIEKKGQR